jgi:ribonuclease-3
MKLNIPQIEKKFGYTFHHKNLLLQALTHSSYAYENQDSIKANNEVLEFLGDSVVGLIVADYFCATYPDLPEGELSKLKSSATSTLALSTLAQKIKLDKNILLGKGEEKSGGRKKRTILAGVFEALTGAIYLDGGFEVAKNFLLELLESSFKKIKSQRFFINNYKSALQEYLQMKNLPLPVYRTITFCGPEHKRSFTVEVCSLEKVLAKATGHSKKNAEQRAAQKALKKLLGKKIKALTPETFILKK